MNKLSSKLDWNRMLGFQQIASDRSKIGKLDAKVGAKIGGKPGLKIGSKIGGKAGLKT